MSMRNLIRKCKSNFVRALYIFLLITQDRTGLRLGYEVKAVVIHATSPCQSRIISDFKGVITSPNYPSPFPEDVECEWRFRAPPNSVLKINMLDLDISEDENCVRPPCCTEHRITIFRDGNPIILCGNYTSKRPITVYQSVTSVKYYSSKNNCEGRGFKLTFSMIPHICKPNELPCFNGKCYSKSSFCRGLNVCGDGSDEAYCYHITSTANYDIIRKQILEHENNINDYRSVAPLWTCKYGSVRCRLSPGHCFFPTTDICDGKYDCPKGEDEIGCNPLCPKQLTCYNGDGCYYATQRCNGIRNCRDNSDESNCEAQSCVLMEFKCTNGACISGSAVCDGDDDCGDFSDEENCLRTSFMRAAVLGLLTCIMLFCVGLACMYHTYTSRFRASPNFVNQLEPEPPEEDFNFREPPPAYSAAINDPRFLTAPDMTERFFESDHSLGCHIARHIRRNRRQLPQGNLDSAPIPRGSGIHNGGNDFNVGPKIDDLDKAYDTEGRSEFQRQLELHGFVRSLQDEHIFEIALINESPFCSPSLSPSRESVTSCTSVDENDDGVNIIRR